MPKAYIVASINVTDPNGFQEYLEAAMKVREEAGGKLLASGGHTEAIEGAFHNRIVVIEFENIEAARVAARRAPTLADGLRSRSAVTRTSTNVLCYPFPNFFLGCIDSQVFPCLAGKTSSFSVGASGARRWCPYEYCEQFALR
jgi:uncharacterized protein (DUF1330 family)